MKNILVLFVLSILMLNVYAQKPEDTEDWSKAPAIITPGKGKNPSSDAEMLYGNKKDIVKWIHENGDPVKWKAGKTLTVIGKTGNIQTVKNFEDVQLHIEWRTPAKITGKGQGRGNSGIFLMGNTKFRSLTHMKMKPIIMDRREVFTNNISHW